MTTDANAEIAAIHDRMPVVIEPADFDRWLDVRQYRPEDVLDLMRPPQDGLFEAVAVGPKVNSAANEGAALQEPQELLPPAEPQLRLL
jgi:putative SOS response-associated peptidase YedK